MAPRDRVLVGHIRGAHGIRGEVRLASFTGDPQAIATYSPLETEAGAVVEIVRLRPQKDGFIAVLKGVTDRNAAEALRGTDLFVPRARLPEPEDDTVYVHDLIGMPVCHVDGTRLGGIVNVVNYGAGDLVEVSVADRKDTVLIPFTDGFVLEAGAGKVVVDLPEGFLDEGAEP